jgi:hypothetical protein
VPVKAHNLVGKVERYYTVIRRAYSIIITKLHGINKDMAL